jgi:hypothetical protein
MIANPKAVAVSVLCGADVDEKTLRIVEAATVDSDHAGFYLLVDDVPSCWSESARALSRWALDRNAKAVRFDFDLRFER